MIVCRCASPLAIANAILCRLAQFKTGFPGLDSADDNMDQSIK